jgi:preprotein translocase subunit YajC
MMGLMFGALYFLMILPNQRRQKKWQQMLSQLKPGDKITTTGGLHGIIVSLKDDVIILRVPPDNLKMEVGRGYGATVTTPEEGTK